MRIRILSYTKRGREIAAETAASLRADGHACRTDIGFTRLNGRKNGIKSHVFNFHVKAEFVTYSLHNIHIYTDDFTVFI